MIELYKNGNIASVSTDELAAAGLYYGHDAYIICYNTGQLCHERIDLPNGYGIERGFYGNNTPKYEFPTYNGKKHGVILDWEEGRLKKEYFENGNKILQPVWWLKNNISDMKAMNLGKVIKALFSKNKNAFTLPTIELEDIKVSTEIFAQMYPKSVDLFKI